MVDLSAIRPSEILRNFLAKKHSERTRYGRFRTIHASDIVGRLDFIYLERLGLLGREVDELARMYQGIMWEHELNQEMARHGYVHEPEYVGEVSFRDPIDPSREITYTLVAHPDFVLNVRRPEHMVELKTTRWSRDDVIRIVGAQMRTMEGLYTYYGKRTLYRWPERIPANVDPRDVLYLYDPEQFTMFYNQVGQIALYRSIFGWRRKIRYTVVFAYRDAVREFDLPDDFLRYMYETYVLYRLPYVAYALWLAENYGFQPWIPYYLVLLDMHSVYGLLGYIANSDLVVRTGLTCPIPPIVTPTDENRVYFLMFDEIWFEADYIEGRSPAYIYILTVEDVFSRWIEDFIREHGLDRRVREEIELYCRPGPRCYRLAKRSLIMYYIWLHNWIRDIARVIRQHYNVPDVPEMVKPPSWFGVRRSPLKIIPELVEQELKAVESKLAALERE